MPTLNQVLSKLPASARNLITNSPELMAALEARLTRNANVGDMLLGSMAPREAANLENLNLSTRAIGDILFGEPDDDIYLSGDDYANLFGNDDTTVISGRVTGDLNNIGYGDLLLGAPKKKGGKATKKVNLKDIRRDALNQSVDAAASKKKKINDLLMGAWILKNGSIYTAPTMGMMEGANLAQTITRVSSQAAGITRTTTTAASSGTATTTFAAPGTGEINQSAAILIHVQQAPLYAFKDLKFKVAITGKDESGATLALGTWTMIHENPEREFFGCLFPYTIIGTRLQPLIVKAQASTNDLVVTVTGLSANAQTVCTLPSLDNVLFQSVLVGLGMKPSNDFLATYGASDAKL
jgi:hypothetical protein